MSKLTKEDIEEVAKTLTAEHECGCIGSMKRLIEAFVIQMEDLDKPYTKEELIEDIEFALSVIGRAPK